MVLSLKKLSVLAEAGVCAAANLVLRGASAAKGESTCVSLESMASLAFPI